jgi:hypothetical protein
MLWCIFMPSLCIIGLSSANAGDATATAARVAKTKENVFIKLLLEGWYTAVERQEVEGAELHFRAVFSGMQRVEIGNAVDSRMTARRRRAQVAPNPPVRRDLMMGFAEPHDWPASALENRSNPVWWEDREEASWTLTTGPRTWNRSMRLPKLQNTLSFWF